MGAVVSWLWHGWEEPCVDIKEAAKFHSENPSGLAKALFDLAILSPVILIITK